MYRKVDFVAKMNTGDILAAGSMRGIRNNIRAYFSVVPDAFYALIIRDGKPCAFVWKTHRRICIVPVQE